MHDFKDAALDCNNNAPSAPCPFPSAPLDVPAPSITVSVCAANIPVAALTPWGADFQGQRALGWGDRAQWAAFLGYDGAWL